jgi:membrane-bound metal-dependent hydrolase YbcI (DUF457 family)
MSAQAVSNDRHRGWRVVIGAIGVLVVLLGGFTFLTDVRPDNYLGVVVWLAGAIVLHDGVGAIGVFVVSVLVRKVGRRVPFIVLVIAQAAAAIWVIVLVLVVPEIVKQAIGTANPSILPLDYTANLVTFSAALVALAAFATATAAVIGRIRRPASHSEDAQTP